MTNRTLPSVRAFNTFRRCVLSAAELVKDVTGPEDDRINDVESDLESALKALKEMRERLAHRSTMRTILDSVTYMDGHHD